MLTPLSMELIQTSPTNLDWSLNFAPKSQWPRAMPAVAARNGGKLLVVAGFERQNEQSLWVLVLNEPVLGAFESLWPNLLASPFGCLEALRVDRLPLLTHGGDDPSPPASEALGGIDDGGDHGDQQKPYADKAQQNKHGSIHGRLDMWHYISHRGLVFKSPLLQDCVRLA